MVATQRDQRRTRDRQQQKDDGFVLWSQLKGHHARPNGSGGQHTQGTYRSRVCVCVCESVGDVPYVINEQTF